MVGSTPASARTEGIARGLSYRGGERGIIMSMTLISLGTQQVTWSLDVWIFICG